MARKKASNLLRIGRRLTERATPILQGRCSPNARRHKPVRSEVLTGVGQRSLPRADGAATVDSLVTDRPVTILRSLGVVRAEYNVDIALNFGQGREALG